MVASDMMNGNGAFDPATSYARISERVENQGRDIVDLRSNMNTGFRNLEASIHTLSSELRGNSRTQWPVIWSAIGVSFVVLAAVGGLAYQPVVSNQGRLEAALVRLAEVAMPRESFAEFKATYENNRIVSRTEYIDKFNMVNSSIATLNEEQVPRKEHERVWSSYDQQLSDKQRQIDEIKQAQNGVYNQRDVTRDILERLDRMESRRILP